MKTKNLKKFIKKLLDSYEPDDEATVINTMNESTLNKAIKKVINHNKKLMLKPINTHLLIKKIK